MYATVNGVRLYFDVEGAGLVADGPVMRKKPTLVLVHSGPGAVQPELFVVGITADAGLVATLMAGYEGHRG